MADKRAQMRLGNSCNILGEVSQNQPDLPVWLDAPSVDKCHNLIGNDTEELCEFEKNTFGLSRKNNNRKYKKLKKEFQERYLEQQRILKNFELELQSLKDRTSENETDLIETNKQALVSIFNGGENLINDISNETKELKTKIVNDYSLVEGSQYKDLLVFYKKIKDNVEILEKSKNNTHYAKSKLENKQNRLDKVSGLNRRVIITLSIFFVTGIILALLFRYL
tara:strand:+ start:344 stop:1012 length:669 start_codon:yes stop_codon:yes gene_type:complete